MSNCRKAIRWGSLMLRTATVARAVCVWPTRTAPCHSKCRFQRWWRGLNRLQLFRGLDRRHWRFEWRQAGPRDSLRQRHARPNQPSRLRQFAQLPAKRAEKTQRFLALIQQPVQERQRPLRVTLADQVEDLERVLRPAVADQPVH